MTDELKQEMTEKFNSAYGEEVKIGLRDALRKVYLDGVEHGYQYAIDKACKVIARLYPKAAAYYEQPENFVEQIRKAMEQ